jgi:hypothetical protein
MASSISSFLSSFNKELSRPSKFDVFISLPTVLSNNNSLVLPKDGLSMRCETTNLPSRTFATAEQKFGSNPIEKYPYQTTYNDIDMTFLVSGDMNEKDLFDAWQESIIPSSTFNPTYKNNYAVDIYIKQYDLRNILQYQIVLHEAYPIAVNQLDLDWSSDSYHKLTVVFAYTYWESLPLTD